MAEKREVAYIFGILSIVFALFVPIVGVVLGVIGLFQNKIDKSKKAQILNIIGIVLGALLFIATLAVPYLIMGMI